MREQHQGQADRRDRERTPDHRPGAEPCDRLAGIKLRPSTLLVFGNPPLGTQFITSNPNAGLDWPVRLLLTQDDNGDVWAVWTDFGWIAKRHNIRDRVAQFEMATKVVGSITSTIATR